MKSKILIFRLSSLGDVAMTIPVIKQFLEQNKNIELIFVSKKKYYPLFSSIKRLVFIGVSLKHSQNILGLYKLYIKLNILSFDYIADLHNVIRTKILFYALNIFSFKKKSLDKGRQEKKKLTTKKNKNLIALKSMHERYADVFRKLGFNLKLKTSFIKIPNLIKSIGIAPFAKYPEKTYSLKMMQNIAYKLAKKNKKIFLIGKGKKEEKELKLWEKMHNNIISIAGKFNLSKELEYIKKVDILISMDSSNMHLASLVKTPCISIWGATHRYNGFLGFNQKNEYCIENTKISCRPCSVFGNKKCYQKTLLCMDSIDEKQILEKIL